MEGEWGVNGAGPGEDWRVVGEGEIPRECREIRERGREGRKGDWKGTEEEGLGNTEERRRSRLAPASEGSSLSTSGPEAPLTGAPSNSPAQRSSEEEGGDLNSLSLSPD